MSDKITLLEFAEAFLGELLPYQKTYLEMLQKKLDDDELK